jgi:lipopolysaccharide/colanic/teichoic acid biosynthesis glycosyltransferase
MSSVDVGGYRVRVWEGAGLPRSVEAFIAAIGLLLATPILLLCILAIKLSSRGPVFFRQGRVGRRGEFFELYKLRTMRVQPPSWALNVTAHDDDRITPVGRILRTMKLDELPELWNVLVGDLSLVGPRPEVPRFVDLGNPLWREALKVRPGLTDPVTLKLRNEEELLAGVGGNREAFYRDVLQPYKLRGYAEYLQRRTPWSDVKVLAMTLLAIVRPSTTPPPTMAELLKVPDLADGRVDDVQPLPASTGGLTLRHVQYLLDLMVLAAAFALSYFLRFDFTIDQRTRSEFFAQLCCSRASTDSSGDTLRFARRVISWTQHSGPDWRSFFSGFSIRFRSPRCGFPSP